MGVTRGSDAVNEKSETPPMHSAQMLALSLLLQCTAVPPPRPTPMYPVMLAPQARLDSKWRVWPSPYKGCVTCIRLRLAHTFSVAAVYFETDTHVTGCDIQSVLKV
eukprot:scaffold22589_cov138-Cylindrotheca_fusiformis.AAC.15